MKGYKLHAGVAAHSCAKHAKHNRSPCVLLKLEPEARLQALNGLWRSTAKGGRTP